jgi:hypothetical protein
MAFDLVTHELCDGLANRAIKLPDHDLGLSRRPASFVLNQRLTCAHHNAF